MSEHEAMRWADDGGPTPDPVALAGLPVRCGDRHCGCATMPGYDEPLPPGVVAVECSECGDVSGVPGYTPREVWCCYWCGHTNQ